jgi:membrane-associated phospholipid phosphatase
MSLKVRIIWSVILLAVLAVYFPINRLASGGWALELPIDSYIPLLPLAVIPYLIGVLLFIAVPVYAALSAGRGEYEALLISVLFVTLMSYIIYIMFPTYVIRPDIPHDSLFSNALNSLYQSDKPYNAAPSGHTYLTLVFALYLNRWHPKHKWIFSIVALAIIASTLLTKQHYVLDVVTGLIMGIGGYVVGRYAQSKLMSRVAEVTK